MTRIDWALMAVALLSIVISLGATMRSYDARIKQLEAEVQLGHALRAACEWERKGDAIRARGAP